MNKSHSHPRVSNDNPFGEAHFRTMKYTPEYPDRFGAIAFLHRASSSPNEHPHLHSAVTGRDLPPRLTEVQLRVGHTCGTHPVNTGGVSGSGQKRPGSTIGILNKKRPLPGFEWVTTTCCAWKKKVEEKGVSFR